ncbi:hypothetical protein [Pseudomonas sp. ANT_J28]|uniref:hypothetical protein n=1 Tax=Pseudomonas sp. ANT_J28 TaxID=2597352 RepID=UPI0021149684|nr:hypothetical protein [Pseudomonas sp. ANT_J28]
MTQTNAGGHQQRMRYDNAGQLKQVFVQLWNGELQCVLRDSRYNAAARSSNNRLATRWSAPGPTDVSGVSVSTSPPTVLRR